MSNKATRFAKTAVIFSVILGLVAVAGYFYWQYRQLATQNPEREIAAISKELRKFMDLPESPLPTMATVTEKEKLQQQEFFQKAENGDKVLIYLSEGKAILYRPSTGKVIDVAPIRQTETPQGAEAVVPPDETEAAIKEPTAITIYNGTAISGAARTLETNLTELSFEHSVTARANAARTNYTSTLVVDLDGSLAAEAAELAELVEGKVGTLPAGEQAPADGGLLIIVGQADAASPSPEATP